MELDQFVGVDGLFIEWRVITDNPAWLIDEGQAPTGASAGGNAGVLYRTVMTDSAAELLRDIFLPRVIAPVSEGVPHIYRLEVCPDQYTWYVDGVVIDSGIPEGPYPDANGFLVWGARREYVDASTAWDYVRVGEMPLDGSGDFDASGDQDTIDYFFVHDCLTKDGPGIFGGPGEYAGPGCRFADFDFDGDVDLRDFAEFQPLFEDYPCEPFCDVPCSMCFSPPRNP